MKWCILILHVLSRVTSRQVAKLRHYIYCNWKEEISRFILRPYFYIWRKSCPSKRLDQLHQPRWIIILHSIGCSFFLFKSENLIIIFPEPTNPHGPNRKKKSDRVDGQDYFFCFWSFIYDWIKNWGFSGIASQSAMLPYRYLLGFVK